MTERDARDLVDWLDQAEAETKATIAEHERIDPFMTEYFQRSRHFANISRKYVRWMKQKEGSR